MLTDDQLRDPHGLRPMQRCDLRRLSSPRPPTRLGSRLIGGRPRATAHGLIRRGIQRRRGESPMEKTLLCIVVVATACGGASRATPARGTPQQFTAHRDSPRIEAPRLCSGDSEYESGGYIRVHGSGSRRFVLQLHRLSLDPAGRRARRLLDGRGGGLRVRAAQSTSRGRRPLRRHGVGGLLGPGRSVENGRARRLR